MASSAPPTPGPSRSKSRRLKADFKADTFYNFKSLTLILQEEESTFNFCRSYGLIPKSVLCPTCHSTLETVYTYQQKNRPSKRHFFQCHKKDCRAAKKYKVPLFQDTWFSGACISIEKSLTLVYCFIKKLSVDDTIIETSTPECVTSSETVCDYFSYCREVCFFSIYDDSEGPKQKIGGINFVVEIDEA